jgi:phage/plasmid-like protein (TIGR03299 family)
MSHLLSTREDGTVEMAYSSTGGVPWHGLGTKLDGPVTSAEAIKAAHLDWEMVTNPVYHYPEPGDMKVVPNKMAVMRKDTQNEYAVASNRYTPLQNTEAFKFFDVVVGAGQAIYHTTGALEGGKRVWILAQLPGTLQVSQKDKIEKYVLLMNSHDTSTPLTVMFTPIRVVCNNTLSMALSDKSQKSFRARHTTNILNKAVDARKVLGLADAYFENFMAGVEQLASAAFNDAQMKEFTYSLFALDPEKSIADQRKNKEYEADVVMDLFKHGRGNDLVGVRNTKWAALNSVTEYIDHHAPSGRKSESGQLHTAVANADRLSSAWLGHGAVVKQQAWDLLFSMN